jgi:hypothetical protein
LRLFLSIIALGILCANAGANDARPSVPLSRNIRGWTVTCDNTRHCTAFTATAEQDVTNEQDVTDGGRLFVRVERDAGPDSTATLIVDSTSTITSASMRLDDQVIDPGVGSWMGKANPSNNDGLYTYRLSTRDVNTVAAWIAIARNAKTMTFVTQKGGAAPQVSLEGLSAALLLMDDVQARVGTETALLRRGDLPSSAVPPAPPMPVAPASRQAPAKLSEAETKALIAATLRQHEDALDQNCDGGNAPELREIDEATVLTSSEALVALGCNRGAYNFEMLWFRVDRKGTHQARPLQLDAYGNDLVNGHLDPATSQLSLFNKVRGVGDCGDWATWQFDGQNFQLIERRVMSGCYGIPSDDWPYLFRSRH